MGECNQRHETPPDPAVQFFPHPLDGSQGIRLKHQCSVAEMEQKVREPDVAKEKGRQNRHAIVATWVEAHASCCFN